MRVLIHERDHTGHRLSGVRVLLEALVALERERPGAIDAITLQTSPEALDSVEFGTQLAPLAGHFRVRAEPGAASHPEGFVSRRLARRGLALGAAFALDRLRTLETALATGEHDHLYVPYGDGLLQLLALRERVSRRPPWPAGVEAETIMMRAGFAYPDVPALTRRFGLHALARSPFATVHLIDPFAWRALERAPAARRARAALMPDPITPTPPRARRVARRALGLPEDGRFVGCVGRLDERKGADLLIAAFLRAGLRENDRLLLAGARSAGVRAACERAADPRIIAFDRYITEEELIDAIAALDLVVTPYPDFTGSASIVIRAAAAGRPCLANDAGWMGYVVPRFGLGALCDVHDESAFARALGAALEAAPRHVPGEAARRFVDYGAADNIRAHWMAGLRRRLGLAPDAALRPWPDAVRETRGA